MKKCTGCLVEKPLEEFYWKNQERKIRVSRCRSCQSARAKARWATGSEKESNYKSKALRTQRARDYIWTFLTENHCVECSESDPIVLEFDHIDENKKKDICQMVSQNYGVKAIAAEIAKCEVVCVNCHRKRTARRGNHWRYVRQN